MQTRQMPIQRSQPGDDDEYDELDLDDYDDDFSGFELGKRLKAPQAKLYTTKELHRLIHEGTIDLNPPYQREVVWPEYKQMKLLDSLWRNYYVPPIVFAVYLDDEGEEIRCCVDGKQRLTSIQKFFDGQIGYKHWRTGKKWWYTTSASQKKNRPEVPQAWKDDFNCKTITCVEYHELPSDLERDIFQRVQMGVALTAAEKLQAISSPWSEWISELQSRYLLHEDSLTQKINVAIKRGLDFQLVASLVYCCDTVAERGQPTSKKLEEMLNRKNKPSEAFKRAINDTFTAFWHIADSPHLNHGFTQIDKRVAPTEFTFIGALLYVMREESHQARANAILGMRQRIRSKFQDIRSRPDIFQELWRYIASVQDNEEEDELEASPPPKKSKKRKAGNDNDGVRGQKAKRGRGK